MESNIDIFGKIDSNYFIITSLLLNDYRLSAQAKILYITLISLQHKGEHITQESLTRVMLDKRGEPSSEKTINRLINELKKTGWLTVTTQKVFDREQGKLQTTAMYIVHVVNTTAPTMQRRFE